MKILFLAIDAGDKHLIREWANDGTLPTLQSLLVKGLVGETRSVDGFYEGSTWPSFYTGVNPARHGFHRLQQIRPGTYDFHRCYPGESVQRPSFWEYLSKAGKKVAILDVPLTGISRNLNGIHMVEWASHDAAYGFHTWPETLKKDVLKRFGAHPVRTQCDDYGRSAQDVRRFTSDLLEGVRRKTELTLYYLCQDEWDFFAQVFTESHCVGHQCWHLHDPAHPNYDKNVVSMTGDPIRDVYKAIDTAIGEILKRVDENTIVFLLATHRMAHNIGASFLLKDILYQLNYLTEKPSNTGPARYGMIRRMTSSARKEWKHLPSPILNVLNPVLRPVYQSVRRFMTGGDLPRIAQGKCFPHENGNLVSGIRINLQGREPNGIVSPGEELESLCREIAEDLLNIVEKDSGIPIVKRVLRTSGFLHGEYIDSLPDLLVEWGEDIRVGSKGVSDKSSFRLQLVSKKTGLIEGDYTYCRTGDHRPEGLFVVVGRGIKPGTIGRTLSIMDFAPTFLSMFGIGDADMDGRPIREISGEAP